MNQGATCYLNSLMQIMFHSSGFRDAVFSTDSTAETVTALKNLFASLQMSQENSIGTGQLRNAFGWSNEVFVQQDAHELFCSMTYSLNLASQHIKDFLDVNWRGTQCGKYVLYCFAQLVLY
jgi:ubiquitin carboxyl-terminal hydrolase 7